MGLIHQTVIHGFLAAEKKVTDNFSSVFTKQDVLEILKIAKFDMVSELEYADPTMLLNPDRVKVTEPTYNRNQIKSAVRDALSNGNIAELVFIQIEDTEFSINGNEISIDFIPMGFEIELIVKEVESHLE